MLHLWFLFCVSLIQCNPQTANLHLAEPPRERKSLVARKGPHLTCAGGQRGDVTGVDQDQKNHVQEQRKRPRASVVEQHSVRNISFQNSIERADAEQHRNHHAEGSENVSDIGPNHASRDGDRGVFHLFTDVHHTVAAESAVEDSNLAEHEGRAHAAPTAVVLPVCKDFFRRVLRRQGNNWDEHDEESNHVNDQTANLQRGHETRTPSVEYDGDEVESPHDQSDLPASAKEVRVVHLNHSLNLIGKDLRASSGTSEPSKSGHPAGGVGQDLLPCGRRELGDPVVLTA